MVKSQRQNTNNDLQRVTLYSKAWITQTPLSLILIVRSENYAEFKHYKPEEPHSYDVLSQPAGAGT
jgi:hypothetical protein